MARVRLPVSASALIAIPETTIQVRVDTALETTCPGQSADHVSQRNRQPESSRDRSFVMPSGIDRTASLDAVSRASSVAASHVTSRKSPWTKVFRS
jgi:hypothetical protein